MMSHDERKIALEQMHAAARAFYLTAVQIGNHPFIEFTGLMNEYIKACEAAHARGIDFSDCNAHTGTPLPLAPHMRAYINEKLECIFTGRVVLEVTRGKQLDMAGYLLAMKICSCGERLREGDKKDARWWCPKCGDRWTPEQVTAAVARYGR
jgi:hypothetical protein